MRVAVKDNVAVAGVEMTCGSRVLEGYVPARDATVVERVLRAGGAVVGKTNMDDLALASSGHSSRFGPTLNVHDPERLAGGSSGGSASAVAAEEADVALGTDQAGSIRIPASWSGVVGLKPTDGLLPYTGAVGLDPTVDHVGPMANTVSGTAAVLSALAGRDGADPRQPLSLPSVDYEAELTGDPSALSIAVVEEGFGRPEGESAVDDRVSETLGRLEAAGATVEWESVPLQSDARAVYTVCSAEGYLATVRGEGVGKNHGGWYDRQFVEAFGDRRRERPGAFPPSAVLTLLLGAYADDALGSEYYAMAMNVRRSLRASYEALFDAYDVVAMPTTPQRAAVYGEPSNVGAWLEMAWPNMANACTFNMTGHPAVSVPIDPVDELPVGLMFAGGHLDDETVLDAALAVESCRD